MYASDSDRESGVFIPCMVALEAPDMTSQTGVDPKKCTLGISSHDEKCTLGISSLDKKCTLGISSLDKKCT